MTDNTKKQETLQLLKECIEINNKYKSIWFKTDSIRQVDKIIALACLLVGLYQTVWNDNTQGNQYILSKYPDFATYISLYDTSDKELISEKYAQIMAYINAQQS